MVNNRVAKKYDIIDQATETSQATDKSSFLYLLPKIISEFSKNCVAYICGYTVRQVLLKVFCETCRKALMCLDVDFADNKEQTHNYVDDSVNYWSYRNALKLIQIKSNGNLILPSRGTYTIALLTEKFFRNAINCNGGNCNGGNK